jgi:hypothetical protein
MITNDQLITIIITQAINGATNAMTVFFVYKFILRHFDGHDTKKKTPMKAKPGFTPRGF